MDQVTNKQEFWAFVRRGWLVSTLLALLILVVSFTREIGALLEIIRPTIVFIGGGVLLVYSVVTGFRGTYQALNVNSTFANAGGRKPGDITLRSIAARSLVINVPILYWGVFLFLFLPQLVQLPLASLSTGSIAALVGACVLMVVSTAFVTHIGVVLVRFSLRFIAKP